MMTLKMKMEMKGWPVKDEKYSLSLIKTGEADFLTLKWDLGFLILTWNEGRYTNPNEYNMKVGIPSISGNLNIESFLD